MNIDKLFFEELKSLKREILIFAIVFAVGIVANLGLLTNQITNPDGILAGNMPKDIPWHIATGRWAIALVYQMRGEIVLPALTTVFAVFLFSLSTVLILELLQLKGIVFSALAGGILISFPTITQYTSYFYMAETFAIGQLLAVSSVWFLHKKSFRLHYFIAVTLLVLATSLFQAMIGIAAILCMLILIQEIKDEKKLSEIFRKMLQFLSYGVLSFVIYYVVAKMICAYFGIQMADYRGINGSFSINFSMLLASLMNIYKTFFAFYFTNEYYAYKFWGVSIVFAMLYLVWIILVLYWIFMKIKTIQSRDAVGRGCLLAILILILPISCVLIGIVANNTYIDFKMIPQMMFPLVAAISWIEKTQFQHKGYGNGIQLLTTGLILFLVIRNVTIANGITEAMKLKSDAARSLSTRVLVLIENNKNYTDDIPIAILGNCENENWLQATEEYWNRVRADTALWGQFWSSEYNTTQSSWYGYFRKFHGLSLRMVDDSTAASILNRSEFQDMPIFPREGCIQVIDGILTVKLSDFQ